MKYYLDEPKVYDNKTIDHQEFIDAVFDAFRQWGDYTRKMNCDGVSFSVESTNPNVNHYVYRDSNAHRFLPETYDKDFNSYRKRILKLTNGRRFQGVINNLQRFSHDLYKFLKVVLDDIYRLNGFPLHQVETGIFI